MFSQIEDVIKKGRRDSLKLLRQIKLALLDLRMNMEKAKGKPQILLVHMFVRLRKSYF